MQPLRDLQVYGTQDDIYAEMEREMQALQPLHLRRIDLIKLVPKKEEKISRYLQRLRDQSEVAEVDKMSPSAFILNLFVFHTSESQRTKNIGEDIVQFFRSHEDVLGKKNLRMDP